MPSASYLRKTLRDDQRALVGWSLGVAVFVMVYVSFWAQIRDDPELARSSAETLPEGLRTATGLTDYASATGYLEATVYNLFVPILLIMCAIILGNRSVAAPEEAGTLDLLLANPVSRRRFVLERFAALAVGLVAVNAVAWLVVMLFVAALDMGIPTAHVGAAALGLLLLSLCFGTLALTVGAAAGRRGVVLAVAGGLSVATYVIRALGVQTEAVRPLRWLSPFHYYLDPSLLRTGFHADLLVLAGMVAALVVAAVIAFDRRDVGV